MPYTGVDDPSLPENVQKMPENNRSAFVQAFNSTLEDCEGDTKECEEQAFKIANAAVAGTKEAEPTVIDRIKEFFSRQKAFSPATLTGFKMLPDDTWIAWYTNAYEDREHEIFANDAIAEDVKRMQESGDYPVLRYYHVRGTEHGKALTVSHIGRFAVAVGKFDESELAEKFKAHYRGEDQALSHGFIYEPENFKDNVYYKFRTFEVSTLPPESAANQYTAFKKGGNNMDAISEEARTKLEKILGSKEAVDQLVEDGKKATEALDGAGVAFKQTDAEMVEAEAAEEEVVAEDKGDIYDKLLELLADKLVERLSASAPAAEEEVEVVGASEKSELAQQVKALGEKLADLENVRNKRAWEMLLHDQDTHGQKQGPTTNPVEDTVKLFAGTNFGGNS